MARQVTITLDVDSSGAVQGIRDVDEGFQDLDAASQEAVEGLSEDMEEVDTSAQDASSGVEDLEDSTEDYSESATQADEATQGLSTTMKAGLAAGAVAAAESVRRVGSRLLDTGIEAITMRRRFETHFQAMTDEMDQFKAEFTDLARVSETEAERMLGTMGGVLRGFGLASEEAAQLSQSAAQVAADLSVLEGQNMSTQRAMRAISDAMLGRRRRLRRLGFAVEDQTVKEKALEMGLVETTDAIDQQVEAKATLAAITDQMADASGLAAERQDTTAAKIERTRASIDDLESELALELLPTWQTLLEDVERFISQNEDQLIRAFEDVGSAALVTAEAVLAIHDAFTDVRDVVQSLTIEIGRYEIGPGMDHPLLQLMGGGEGGSGVDLTQQEGVVTPDSLSSGGVGGGTGGGGGSEEEGPTAAQELRQELEKQMQVIERMIKLPVGPDAQDRIQEQMDAIKSLLEQAAKDTGIDLGSAVVEEMRARLRSLSVRQSRQRAQERAQGPSGRMSGVGVLPTQREIEEDVNRMSETIAEGFTQGEVASEEMAEETEKNISRIINASASMGQALARAFGEGEASAQSMIASVLQGIGSIISASGNPVAGAAVSGTGGLIGSFKHGGDPSTSGLAKMHPPEIVQGVQGGSHIVGREETMQILDQARGGNSQAVVEEIRSLRGAMHSMQLRVSASETNDTLSTQEGEEERMGVREYTPRN